MEEYLRGFAERFGVFGMKFSKRMPNTLRALATAEYARQCGVLDAFRSAVMEAHWRNGLNIEDPDTIAQLAGDAGLDPDKAKTAGDDPEYVELIRNARLEYKSVHTGGIPTFVIASETVEGCVPFETLAEAAVKAGAKRRLP